MTPVATPTELVAAGAAAVVSGAALLIVTNPKRSRPHLRRTAMPSQATRAYLYRLAVAVIALAVVLGLVDVEFVDEIDEIIVAALGLGSAGLAAANTTTKKG